MLETNLKQGSGEIQFQNDSALSKRQAEQIFEKVESSARIRRQMFKGLRRKNTTWFGNISYTFNTSDQDVRKAFKMGVKVWTDNTCVDFVEDGDALDKVVVVKRMTSFSAVGRQGGDQLLSLSEDGKSEGSAVHEIGHVLGLLHTMTRYDRENFIKVVMENINPLSLANFVVMSRNYVEVYGLGYDYGSVMHYGELSGTINNQTTMIALNPLYQKTMGSLMISFSDIFMVNEHYGCNARCNKSTSAKCGNEGFPHPRNCSICICPGGYGGALCDRRPPGCGEDLVATSTKQSVNYTLGSGSGLRDHFSFCNYMIVAPVGKKIEMEVQSISDGYDEPGCPMGGVEIKAQRDQKLTGYRYCTEKGTGSPIHSYSNRLPVVLFNRLGSMEVVLAYRYID